ncbi:TonB-dependent receptor [Rubellicoccus peritrichatus]|uniref:TonB-dependent receptor n=1 Tax=Rubellicoccus peritrichatus TaxID=3080537 RepID=A0AAQ3L6D0_9BACT|nr:TonB-dependent receptor [Puniceicoccus sp. CR14]WOO40130.1 TonB-dependent receptor [Puniceicoccus sp. CR14]
MYRNFRLNVIVATLLGVSPLCAQKIDDIVELEPFVVTASRFDELAENIPVNLDLITAETIEKSGATDLVEVLEKEAGVFFRSTSGNASDAEIDLRGFGENSGVRTLVLVDGVKLNRPDIGALNWLQIPLSEIESVEVLRGTQTALYGNNATGGVVKITTKRGLKNPGGTLTGIVGNYGLANIRGGYSGNNGAFTASVNAEYNQLNGYRDNSRYVAKSGSMNLGYNISEKLSIRGSFAYIDTASLLPGGLTLAQAQNTPRQSFASPETSFSNEQIWRLDGVIDYALDDQDRLELTAGYNRRDLSWNLEGPGADNLIQTVTVSPKQIIERNQWKLVYGLDYIHDSLDFDIFQNNRTINSGNGSLTRDSIGGYGQVQYEIDKQWIASAGLRLEGTFLNGQNTDLQPPIDNFDANKNDFGTAFDLGLVYKVSDELRIWSRFDRLYRYPATDEIAAYQGFPLSQPFNFDLDPETGYNVEVGLDWERSGFFGSANLFAMWLDGEIGFDFVQNLNLNIGDTRRLGVDLSFGYRSQLWSLRADYSFIDANYTGGFLSGQPIWLVPRQRFSLRGEINPTKELSFVARYSYTAEQLQGNDITNTLPRIPSFQLVDLLARYEIRDWLDVFVGVDNVFDENYFSVAFVGTYYPASGRTYKGGLTARF